METLLLKCLQTESKTWNKITEFHFYLKITMKITSKQEENKQLKDERKALQESVEFKNEIYEKMKKKDTAEEKQKLETDNRKNEEVQNLIQ